jgi:putative protease
MRKVELLSPVGNKEMLYQAIHNGADAVYLAGKNYGARKFSDNFTNEELVEAIKYCHLYGVLIYVTVNTIIFEEEVEEFIKYIEFLYTSGVDAVIMQDIGMIKLVREKFPNLDVHASTQSHTHNNECVKIFKQLGCTRVVLAREMELNEIKNIDINIEKEVFVYGALCVCYSGECLFSSLNGGRSGNRGECVGSCRLPYKLIKNKDYIDTKYNYLLSTKELNTLDKLKEILESNIDSLKIEGRMKSPAYVGYVTRLYRILIDKYYKEEELKLSNNEIINLKKLFNREFTNGYLFNDDIMNIKTPNHIGVPIGKVIKFDKQKIYIKLKDNLMMEDGIRFKNSNKGMIINKLYNNKYLLVKKVTKDNICIVDNKIGLKNKDLVLKTIDKELINYLENYPLKRIEVSFKCKFKINNKFKITISDGINEISADGCLVEKAIKRSVSKEDIIKRLSKLGNTAFKVKNIEIDKDDNIFVGLKSINEIRRKLVEALTNLRSNKKKKIIIKDYNIPNNNLNKDNKCYLNVLVRNLEQLNCCLDNKVDNIYITDYNLYNKYNYLDNVYYRCSRVNKTYKNLTNEKLLVGEVGSINKYKNNNYLVGDYYLNVNNSYSIKYLNSLGLKRLTLSVELNDEKIRKIMQDNYNVELIIYGRLELMIMKYCPLKKCLNYCRKCKNSKDKFYLEANNKERYPIIHENCLTHIMASKNINKINMLTEYQKLGIKHYRIELFDEDYEEAKKIIQRLKNVL